MADFEFLGDDPPDSEGEEQDDLAGFADPVEPGSPSLENALFVVLGALSVLVIVARLAGFLG